MLKTIIGVITGCIVGIAVGVSFVAPGLDPTNPVGLPQVSSGAGVAPIPSEKSGRKLSWALGSTFPAKRPHVGTIIEGISRDIWRVSGGAFEMRFSAAVPGKRKQADANAAVLAAVAAGSVDAVFTTPDAWKSRGAAMHIFAGMPFGPDTSEFLAWFDHGGGRDAYQTIHHKYGTHGLLCGVTPGSSSGWFRRPVALPEDLKGLKVRASGLSAAIYSALGAEPIDMAESAIAAAFEAGTLDVASLERPSMDGKLPLEQSARHYYLSGWQPPTRLYELAINLTRWENLSPAHKSRLQSICGNSLRLSLAETEAAQFASLKDLQARNVEIHRWPREILTAGMAAWDDIVKKAVLTDGDFRPIWESLTAFREDYGIWRELKAQQ